MYVSFASNNIVQLHLIVLSCSYLEWDLHVTVCVWRSEDHLWELVFFHHVGSG